MIAQGVVQPELWANDHRTVAHTARGHALGRVAVCDSFESRTHGLLRPDQPRKHVYLSTWRARDDIEREWDEVVLAERFYLIVE